MSTESNTTITLVKKWAIVFIVLIAYYFFSFSINYNAYILSRPPENGEHFQCGMPLLGCLVSQIIIAVMALAIIFIRMAVGKSFSGKHYLIMAAILVLPIITVVAIVFF